MKKFTLASITLLFLYGTVLSQPVDPTLARTNEQTETNSPNATKIDGDGDTKEVENATLEIAPVTFEPFKMRERTRPEKVGPQGEDVFMQGKHFYYLNDKGKKVKVRKHDLRDTPKHS